MEHFGGPISSDDGYEYRIVHLIDGYYAIEDRATYCDWRYCEFIPNPYLTLDAALNVLHEHLWTDTKRVVFP